jgi:hypothetical protein
MKSPFLSPDELMALRGSVRNALGTDYTLAAFEEILQWAHTTILNYQVLQDVLSGRALIKPGPNGIPETKLTSAGEQHLQHLLARNQRRKGTAPGQTPKGSVPEE